MRFDRASIRLKTAPLFANNNPHPNGVEQGALGDCYFLAACSAAAEYPARIKNAFITQTLVPEGIIVVTAMILGRPTTIYVDDFLPFIDSTSTVTVYAGKGDDNSLWLPFMEKVFAKASGNYEIIEGGWFTEAVRFLTGAPT
jgi:Calpain family cysteine protease